MVDNERPQLTDSERQVLQMLAGERQGEWGAWVSACLEALRDYGLCTSGPNYQLTEAGRRAHADTASLRGEPPSLRRDCEAAMNPEQIAENEDRVAEVAELIAGLLEEAPAELDRTDWNDLGEVTVWRGGRCYRMTVVDITDED